MRIDAVDARFQALWTQAARRIGQVVPKVPRWSTPGGRRVVVIAAHPDDETLGCGGTIALHARHSDEVTAVVVTDGRRSRSLGVPADEVARIRADECRAATSLLGVSRLVALGFPEGDVTAAAACVAIRVLVDGDVDVLYAPSYVDFHPDHQLVAHALALALDATGARPEVRVYAAQVPLGPTLTNLVADTSAVDGDWRAAIAAYPSQARSLRCGARMRAYAAACYRTDVAAEPFWSMSAAAYVAMHARPPTPARFRGLRPRAMTDPLAWAVGTVARRRLATGS